MLISLIKYANYITKLANLTINKSVNPVFKRLLLTMGSDAPKVTTLDVFQGSADRYDGLTINAGDISLDNDTFINKLKESLIQWNIAGKKAVWFKIPLAQSKYIPILAEHGFEYHHAKREYVMMTKWLKTTPNTLPPYPFTFIGVAGLAVNDQNEILVVQERYHVDKQWKFPGGYANPKEEFGATAVREVLEETGVETEFVSLLALRHHHKFQFGCSDIYIVCLLKPISTEIKRCQQEISDCTWMKIEEFKVHPQAAPLNKLFVDCYEKSKVNKLTIGVTQVYSKYTNQNQSVYHIKPTRD